MRNPEMLPQLPTVTDLAVIGPLQLTIPSKGRRTGTGATTGFSTNLFAWASRTRWSLPVATVVLEVDQGCRPRPGGVPRPSQSPGTGPSDALPTYRYGDEMASVVGVARVLMSCADEFLEG